jgi:peptidoglycan hydrolase-like protein with peptidoglycan-binding domain
LNDDNSRGRQRSRPSAILRWLIAQPRGVLAAAVAAIAAIAIAVNALFMQSGPHPAPMFANNHPRTVAPAKVAVLPPRRPVDAKGDVTATARARSDVVGEIQRELSKRGFYDGAADGLYGPKTDAAIRDFEKAAGLRASAEPNEVLLAAITRSSVKAAPPPAVPADPISTLLAPNRRVLAVQRALSDFGYGPVKPTGVYDADTRTAVERFERARKRPVTGQINDHLVRELAVLTGRPLE